MRKRIKYKNIFSMGIAVSVFSFTSVGIAHAQECAALPTCEEFGYLYTAEECEGQKSVKCPFDQTKYFCLEDNKSSGNCTNPKVGDILYSDMSCSSDVVSGKTPIAVVFHAEKRLAIALQTTTALWSAEYFDVPGLTDYHLAASVKADWAGKSNTDTALSYCKLNSKSCPAFEYVSTYTTAGTKAGDWYLPALGELNVIYTNKAALNSSLTKAKGQTLPVRYHWSSSEISHDYAWRLYIGTGDFYGNGKNNSDTYVRPVLEF